MRPSKRRKPWQHETMILRKLILLAATAVLSSACSTQASDLIGRASVVDGDTIEVQGTRIRLHGIDAPESNQACTSQAGRRWRCGQQAALALADHLGSRPLRCETRDIDQYGRLVAECFLGTDSINRWMVRNGWAIAYRQYSRAYVGDEQLARQEERNIWSGDFQEPADHRRAGRAPITRTTGTPSPDPACPIKGNINRRGDRIYHAPGQADYDRTVIDTSAGERWFCSHDQARAAGWRQAQR